MQLFLQPDQRGATHFIYIIGIFFNFPHVGELLRGCCLCVTMYFCLIVSAWMLYSSRMVLNTRVNFKKRQICTYLCIRRKSHVHIFTLNHHKNKIVLFLSYSCYNNIQITLLESDKQYYHFFICLHQDHLFSWVVMLNV